MPFRNPKVLREGGAAGRKRAFNHCRWLWIGESTLCAKECVFEYCKQHSAQRRRGAVDPKPCRKCGRGTQANVQLCVGCGQREVTLACISIERKARSQFKRVLQELLNIGKKTNLSLVYFGAGWDMQPLSEADYKAFRRFIFIDALTKVPHHLPVQAGYEFSKDRESFVHKVTAEAEGRSYKLWEARGDHLIYKGPEGRTLEYHINTTVEEALKDPKLAHDIHMANWLHVEGFWPTEFGLNASRDMPNLFRNLADLREKTSGLR